MNNFLVLGKLLFEFKNEFKFREIIECMDSIPYALFSLPKYELPTDSVREFDSKCCRTPQFIWSLEIYK